MVGAGESGKSTVLKQMRLIYTKDGFSSREKEEWRIVMFENIMDALKLIIDAMDLFNIKFESDEAEVWVDGSTCPQMC